MEYDEMQTRLRHLAFTNGIDGERLDKLAALASPMRWKTDQVIFREGDFGKALYVVEEGRVAIDVRTSPNAEPTTILTIGRGQVLGWSSVFYERPKSATARAVEPTTALAIDAHGLAALFNNDPELGYILSRRLLQVVSERLMATRIQLLDQLKQSEAKAEIARR